MSIAYPYKMVLGVSVIAALSLPAYSAFADSMPRVSGRSAEQIERDFGRASGDAYWQRREPSPLPPAVVEAYTETKEFLTQPPAEDSPERYGRAGGFVGLDNLQSPAWAESTQPARGAGG